MRRLSPVILAATTGLLTLLLLSHTRWVVLNQYDLLKGGPLRIAYNSDFYSGTVTTPGSEPSEPSTAQRWYRSIVGEVLAWLSLDRRSQGELPLHPTDPEGELGTAVSNAMEYRPPVGRFDSKAKFKSLRRYIEKYPRDAAARATYGCLATSGLISAVSERAKGAAATASAREAAQEVLHAVEGSEALEPDNALFPFLRSAAYLTLGRENEAAEAFHLAASKPRYDVHAFEVTGAQIHAFESTYGYRGQTARVTTMAGYLFPQSALMKPLARWIIARDGVDGRASAMRFGRTVALSSDVLIDVLVGRAVMVISLAEGVKVDPGDQKPTYAELQANAERFDNSRFDFVGATRELKPLLESQRDMAFAAENDPFVLLMMPRTSLGASALLALVLAFPLFFLLSRLGRMKAYSDRMVVAAPQLAWLTAIPIQFGFGLPVAAIGVLLFVTALAMPESRLRFVRMGAFILAGMTTFSAMTLAPWLLLPVGMFALAYGLSNWSPKGRIAPGLIGVLGIITLFVLSVALVKGVFVGAGLWPLFLVGCVGAAVAIMPKVRSMPEWPASVAMALACVAYLGCVAWELRDDRALGNLVEGWKNEASEYRQRIGVDVVTAGTLRLRSGQAHPAATD